MLGKGDMHSRTKERVSGLARRKICLGVFIINKEMLQLWCPLHILKNYQKEAAHVRATKGRIQL